MRDFTFLLSSSVQIFCPSTFRVEFSVVAWEFLRYLTLGQSLLQKTLWESTKSSGKSQKFRWAVLLWD